MQSQIPVKEPKKNTMGCPANSSVDTFGRMLSILQHITKIIKANIAHGCEVLQTP
jgi:hypothetical protein